MPECERLFFGIGLDCVAKNHIESWLKASVRAKKPSTPMRNWHLTLAFLPNVSPEQKRRLMTFAQQLQVSPFSLHFSEIGYWAHNGIFYLKPEYIPSELTALAEPLRAYGHTLGIYENPYTFSPHITLYRNHKPTPEVLETIEPLSITVDSFHLYHSYRNALQELVYQPVMSFRLR